MVDFETATKGYGKAKKKILEMLWAGEWILGDSIRDAIGQSYYDRRIRELRDEDGWEIETGWTETESGAKRPAYRLISQIRGEGFRRIGVSAKDRSAVDGRITDTSGEF